MPGRNSDGSVRRLSATQPDQCRPETHAFPTKAWKAESVELAQASFFALCACLAYFMLGGCLSAVVHGSPDALQLWRTEVPLVLSQMSATAFFTAMLLNLTSFLFEDSVAKRQLALLSCTIKAAACYTDLMLATEQLPVVFDAHGSLFVPHRYIQWIVTTPLMVLILSKLSDFHWKRTAIAMGADIMMIVMGLASHFMPSPWHWLPFGLSMGLFVFVMSELASMVASAIKESAGSSDSMNSRRSLVFIYICTLIIWSLFPVAWITTYINPSNVFANETLVMFANFGAKVLFSSSIMYGNYITIAQRRIFARLDEENRDRIQMITELKEAVTRKDQFMSLMSHELRTPLNGIIQLGDALCRGAGGELNPKGQHFLRTIKNSSNHLLNIINDILDVAALKEGKLTIKHEAVNLGKAVEHVCDIVAPLAKKEVAIERRIHPGTPLIVADFSRVVQILYNLLGNSLKFTQRGLVRVTVAPVDKSATHVIITVEDTGIGIAKDKIPHIWGAFEQVDMSVTRKYGGTGLGLNIVKQLVTAHEGEIKCKSKEGRGTVFTMRLPVMLSGRAIRHSLEAKIQQSVESLGYDFSAVRRSFSARSGSLNGSVRASSVVDASRSNTGELMASGSYTNPNMGGSANNLENLAASDEEDVSERFIKRRTKELEKEALMNDLARRTDHKRSIDSEESVGLTMAAAAQHQQHQQLRQQLQEQQVNPALLGEKLAHQRQIMQAQGQEQSRKTLMRKRNTSWSGAQRDSRELWQVEEAPSMERTQSTSPSNTTPLGSLGQKPAGHATAPLPCAGGSTPYGEPSIAGQQCAVAAGHPGPSGTGSSSTWEEVVPQQAASDSGHAGARPGSRARPSSSAYVEMGPGEEKEPPRKHISSLSEGAASQDASLKGLTYRVRRASSTLLLHGRNAAASIFTTLFPNVTSSQTSNIADDEPVEFGAPPSLLKSSDEDEDGDRGNARSSAMWNAGPSPPSKGDIRWQRTQMRGMGGKLGGKCHESWPEQEGNEPHHEELTLHAAHSDNQLLRGLQGMRRTNPGHPMPSTSTTCSNMSRRSLDMHSNASGQRFGRHLPSHTSMDSDATPCSNTTTHRLEPRTRSTLTMGLSMEKLAYSNMYGSAQILSVDDEEVNQIVLEEILTSAGYQYARAMDGDEAMDWLCAQDTLPDLILLDCMMPNMSGHEFCTLLRQHIPGTMLPVIMVSAKSNEENIVEGLRSGSNDFIRKPYQREELLARIETQLRLKNDSWWLAELMNNQDGQETESMKLLKNILPESIIQRMQSGQKFVADSHSHVVILFSDIVGFTRLSSKLPTAEIFLMLSNMFNAFDKLTDRFSVYKVETIGDAYMVAAGHDEDDTKAKKGTPVERVLKMARAMMDVVKNITAPNGECLRIRIGVHCGPAFAGVIGSKCPRYCFLGDTVNTASRMESMSFPMCIQVSAAVHKAWPEGQDELVQLRAREVKGKGKMTTFLLKYGQWEEGLETLDKGLVKAQVQQQEISQEGTALGITEGARPQKGLAVGHLNQDLQHLDTPSSSCTITTLTKPWEKEDMEGNRQLPSNRPLLGFSGGTLAQPYSYGQDQFLLSHDDFAQQEAGHLHLGSASLYMDAMKAKNPRAFLAKSSSELLSQLGAHNSSANGASIPQPAPKVQPENDQHLQDDLHAQLEALQAQLQQAGQEASSARMDAQAQRQQAQQLAEELHCMERVNHAPPPALHSPPFNHAHTQQLHSARDRPFSSLDLARPPQWVTDARPQWASSSLQHRLYTLRSSHSHTPSSPAPKLLHMDSAVHSPPATSQPLPIVKAPPKRQHTAPPELIKSSAGWLVASSSASPKSPTGTPLLPNQPSLRSNALLAHAGHSLLVPALSLGRLFEELGLEAHVARFEDEAIHLDMLLNMDFKQLEALGLHSLGHCICVREAVLELAKSLLRMCESRAATSSEASLRLVIPQDLAS